MGKIVIYGKKADFVRKNYLKIPGNEIANKLKVSKTAVYGFLKREGLKVPRELSRKWAAEKLIKPLTKKEVEYISENIKEISINQMARKLKRTEKLLSDKLHELGYSDSIRKHSIDSQRKPGQEPPNKGKKMSPEIREKVKHTWFPKGHKPHNTLKDGYITIRSEHPDRPGGKDYKWIRISEGEWEHLHRFNYRKKYGKIPEGMMVAFKDGDTMNCEPENLELISMEENMMRNTIHNYPEELKKTIRLTAKLKRKIKSHE